MPPAITTDDLVRVNELGVGIVTQLETENSRVHVIAITNGQVIGTTVSISDVTRATSDDDGFAQLAHHADRLRKSDHRAALDHVIATPADLWVADGPTIRHIDPATSEVTTLHASTCHVAVSNLAYDTTLLYTNTGQPLLRIDLATGSVNPSFINHSPGIPGIHRH